MCDVPKHMHVCTHTCWRLGTGFATILVYVVCTVYVFVARIFLLLCLRCCRVLDDGVLCVAGLARERDTLGAWAGRNAQRTTITHNMHTYHIHVNMYMYVYGIHLCCIFKSVPSHYMTTSAVRYLTFIHAESSASTRQYKTRQEKKEVKTTRYNTTQYSRAQ